MSVLGDTGLAELWALIKFNFANKIGVSPASTTVGVQLKNNAGIVLQTGTLPAATAGAAGVMTAADKTKLDGIAVGATAVTVDSAVTAAGTNPVSGAGISTAIQSAIANAGHLTKEVANSVPSAANANEDVLYYVMNSASGYYDIYQKIGNEVVRLDDVSIDLSNYATLSDLPSEMTAAEVDAICT